MATCNRWSSGTRWMTRSAGTEAGFLLTGFYEDIDPWTVIGRTIPSFIATRARKTDLR